MRTIALILLGLIATIAGIQVVTFAWHVKIGKNLARHTQAFSYPLENPDQRLLIAGDSTALGTGAETPSQSTAGYFHQDFPRAEIVNLSKNGAKVTEVIQMLGQAEGKFDLVLIQAGANNIIYFTPLAKARADMTMLIEEAKKYSNNVLILTSGNVGMAPIFQPPLSWVYTYRARRFLAEFEQVAVENDAAFVKLFQEKKDDVFINDIKKYYAADRLHLTGEGYKVWYEQIRKTMAEHQITF